MEVFLGLLVMLWKWFSESTFGHWVGYALMALLAYGFIVTIIEDIVERTRKLKGDK